MRTMRRLLSWARGSAGFSPFRLKIFEIHFLYCCDSILRLGLRSFRHQMEAPPGLYYCRSRSGALAKLVMGGLRFVRASAAKTANGLTPGGDRKLPHQFPRFAALPFVATDDGGVAAGQPVRCINERAALACAERMLTIFGNVGSVALRKSSVSSEKLDVLQKFGDVPSVGRFVGLSR